MLQTRSYEICRLSGNLIQWRKSLFDTVLGYNNKNKPLLRYKFGSVYVQCHCMPKHSKKHVLRSTTLHIQYCHRINLSILLVWSKHFDLLEMLFKILWELDQNISLSHVAAQWVFSCWWGLYIILMHA